MLAAAALVKRSLRPLLLKDSRAFHASSVLLKRRDGASGSIVKTPRQFSKPMTKQEKKKKDISRGHKDHVGRMRALKYEAKQLEKQEAAFTAFEQDEELLKEYDRAFEETINAGRHREYIYADVIDVTLRDLNPDDVAADFYRLKPKEQTIELLNDLMRVYAIHKRPEETEAILAQLEQHNPDAPIPATPVPTAEESTSNELVVAPKRKLSPRLIANEKTYVYHISALAETKQAAKAVRVMGRMKELGVEVTEETYNAVMQACNRSKRPDWAYNIFEKMQAQGIQPSGVSFTILMNASIAVGDIDRAFETFHIMRSYVEEPGIVAFTSLIHGYAKIGRVERCVYLLEDMLDLRITPNNYTYNSLIYACSKSYHYAHKAWEFFYEMQDQYDIIPDVVTYAYMMSAAARHGDIRSAEKLLYLMEKHAVPQTSTILISLINVYARAQIKSIVRKAKCNIPPPEPLMPIMSNEKTEWDEDGNIIDLDRPGKKNVYSDHNMGYDEDFDEDEFENDNEEDYDNVEWGEEGNSPVKTKGLTEEEQEILKRYMVDRKPIALPGLPEKFGAKEVEEVEDLAEVDTLAWNPMDYEIFNHFQNSNRDKAKAIYEKCLQLHGPSSALLNTMHSTHANALRLRDTREFMDVEFAKHNIQPDIFTYRSLMRMYTRAKRPQLALDLVRELHEKGIQPDATFYGYLVNYFAKQRKLRSAMEVLEEMDRYGLRIEEKDAYVLRKLVKKYGIYTELLSEDPNAIHSMSHAELMEMRRERTAAIQDNKKYNRKFYIPRRSEDYL
ncbi:hypothetical protein AeMF1_000821 [Aphanomyces euteiches]|nr:hypothetical protein AeMF1_000821 [Aphanomyces euteiches]KAH9184003.1 hypothetical protein AeNC1_014020 [Aphanomyces euteiches]